MPSKSPAQANLMRAVAHGWEPDRINGPSRAVAQEFVEADKKYSGGFAENRYWTGGLAAMNEINSGVPVTLSFQRGGRRGRPYRGGAGAGGTGGAQPTPEELSRWYGLNPGVPYPGTGGGGAAGPAPSAPSGPAAPTYVSPTGETIASMYGDRYASADPLTGEAGRFQAEKWGGSEFMGDVPIDMSEYKTSGPGGMFTENWETSLRNQGYIEDPTTRIFYPWQPITGDGTSGGITTPGTTPVDLPRVIPGAAGTSTPGSTALAGGPSQTSEERAAATAAARQSSYRDQLREHKLRTAALLNPTNAARGGHMNYQEGGAVPEAPQDIRQGLEGVPIAHAEGPNPYNFDKNPSMYRDWERRNHRDPPAPPKVAAVPEEGGGIAAWVMDALGFGAEEERKTRTERELEAIGEARGGYMRGYQAGGLARVAPPSGGVPPWVEPVEYMEPEGYQAGGLAQMQADYGRQAQALRQQPYQQFNAQRALPQQQMQRMQQAQRGAAGASRWSPQQQASWRGRQQMQQQRALPQQRQQQALQQRAGMAGMQADYQAGQQALAQRGAPGAGNPALAAQNRAAEAQFAALRGGARPAVMPGGGQMVGGSRGLTGPWQGSPETNPMRPRGPLAPGGGPLQLPGRGGGGIPGGARVPPNMQGYLQKQRMMNRPPSNVGGGVNRVGQQDQQGALSRAMQRGTGRRPMSRRGGFPGRGVR